MPRETTNQQCYAVWTNSLLLDNALRSFVSSSTSPFPLAPSLVIAHAADRQTALLRVRCQKKMILFVARADSKSRCRPRRRRRDRATAATAVKFDATIGNAGRSNFPPGATTRMERACRFFTSRRENVVDLVKRKEYGFRRGIFSEEF